MDQSEQAFHHDTVPPRAIVLTRDQAVSLLQNKFRFAPGQQPVDTLFSAIGRLLVAASSLPFDSTRRYLKEYPYNSLRIAGDTLPSFKRQVTFCRLTRFRKQTHCSCPQPLIPWYTQDINSGMTQ
jgi:hypothetical protein